MVRAAIGAFFGLAIVIGVTAQVIEYLSTRPTLMVLVVVGIALVVAAIAFGMRRQAQLLREEERRLAAMSPEQRAAVEADNRARAKAAEWRAQYQADEAYRKQLPQCPTCGRSEWVATGQPRNRWRRIGGPGRQTWNGHNVPQGQFMTAAPRVRQLRVPR